MTLVTPPEAARQALIAVVAEALADPHPDIPHEEVRAEIMAGIEELERRTATSLPSSPAVCGSHGGPRPGRPAPHHRVAGRAQPRRRADQPRPATPQPTA